MRTRFPAFLAALVVLAVVPLDAGPAAAVAPATAKVVVYPVTSSGHAAAGFAVHAQHGFTVDCSDANPSPGALSPNIELCYPSAAYAVACWKAAAPGKVLCMRDPSTHKLYRISRGRFASTAINKPRNRAPLLIVLGDGTRCQIRVGGAWGQPKGHPNLYGAYSCDRHGAAWLWAKGSHRDSHNGIDESSATWRIRVGENTIVWRNIAKAYFVATAS